MKVIEETAVRRVAAFTLLLTVVLVFDVLKMVHAQDLVIDAEFGATFERENSSGLTCDTSTSFTFLTDTAVRVGVNGDGCNAEERGVYEFEMPLLNEGETIHSAILVLSDPIDAGIDLHGYEGDGVTGVADGNTENKIGVGNGTNAIDVTSYLLLLSGGSASFSGFMLDDPSLSNTDTVENGDSWEYSIGAVLELEIGPETSDEECAVIPAQNSKAVIICL